MNISKKCIYWVPLLLTGCVLQGNAKSRPNVIFILADDLGYKDLGCYGSTFYETPNIDKLAAKGALFTNAYSACAVSSPSRAAILTGKYPSRLKITDWIGPESSHVKGKMTMPACKHHLPLEEITMAEAFRQVGYSTCFIGKWHLGKSDYFPDKQGFDINIGGIDAGSPPSYFSPYTNETFNKTWGWEGALPNLVAGPSGEYLTDRLTDEAINFLDTIRGKPFFLYFSHYAVHMPLQAKKELTEKYREKAAKLSPQEIPEFIRDVNGSYTRTIQNHAIYAAMIESLDESVGRVMRKLEETGLSENTIIVFVSDNGGLTTSNFQKYDFTLNPSELPTSVLPLRTGKGFYYEGGVRVPVIIYQPGAASNGKKSDVVVTGTDFYPTLLEMCGIRLLKKQHVDGESLLPVLSGKKDKLQRKAIYWHYPHYHGYGETPVSAIRKGRYKLIQHFENQKVELYDLETDISEKNDLSSALPGVKADLSKDLEKWRRSVNADYAIFPSY